MNDDNEARNSKICKTRARWSSGSDVWEQRCLLIAGRHEVCQMGSWNRVNIFPSDPAPVPPLVVDVPNRDTESNDALNRGDP